MDAEQLKNLPSTFYRVAVKCLVFNDANQLLIAINSDDEVELPGGGWEHGESLNECVQRELAEELGVQATAIGEVQMVLQGRSDRGFAVLRIAVSAVLDSTTYVPGDDIVAARFVDKAEFKTLTFAPVDVPFRDAADQIWLNR